jgi:Domain of unknown function (DUF222)
MFDKRKPLLRPALVDAATTATTGAAGEADDTGDVAAVLARWTVEDPCPAAVAALAGIDPMSLDDADRVRLVIALERQAAWVASLQLPALTAVGDAYAEVVEDARDRATERLTAVEAADPDATAEDRDGRSVAQTVSRIFGDDPDRWATMELATGLHVAEFTAGQRLHVARVLSTRLPHLDHALRLGVISYGHVLLVVRATEPLSDELAREVDAKLAPRYGKATPGGLRNTAGHLVVAADPEGAQARHEEAARRRQVSSRPENDGMATLALFTTAPDISTLEAAIFDIADRTAKAAHDAERLIPDQDALHADALIALARYWLEDTWPIPEPDPRDQPQQTPHAGADTPAQQPPGQRGSSRSGSHDLEPPGPEPDADRGDGADPDGEDADEVPAGRRGAQEEPPVKWGKRGPRRRGRDRTVVNIVMDLPTLLGLADNPARLEGYGTIPAGLARRIAADASWRRMITDPITRRLLDRSPRTYRPGDALAAFVRSRDLMCDHPGCTKPAEGCQLDHDDAFDLTDPDGGRTTAEELKLRCEPHHNGKTHLGWATGSRADGTRYTRSPLGFDYDLEPNPHLAHGQTPPTPLRIIKTD